MLPSGVTFADRFEGISGSAIRAIFKVLNKPDMISFAGGNPSNEALDKLRRGVYMEGDERRTYPAQVRVVRDESLFSDILVTIHEGRNRQVRRMFDSVGHKVLLLRRVRFGPLDLGDLRRGEWRELSAEEIARLKAL